MAAVEKKSCKGLKIAVVILVLLLAAGLALMYLMYTEGTKQIADLNAAVDDANREIANRQSLNDTLTEENEALYSDNLSLKDEISGLKEEIKSLEEAAEETAQQTEDLQKQYDELNAQYQKLLDEQ